MDAQKLRRRVTQALVYILLTFSNKNAKTIVRVTITVLYDIIS